MNVGDLLQTSFNILVLPINILYVPIQYSQKKHKLHESGYIVDPPLEYFFHPEKYSTYKRHWYSPTIYTKYGMTYTYEEIISGNSKLDRNT